MKVKVIKAGLPSYWYANRIGEIFEAEPFNSTIWEFKLIDVIQPGVSRYFDKGDVEIINQEKSMFDMKKDKWFIRTPTPEISKLVQEWLFEQGFSWQAYGNKEVSFTDTNYLMLSPYEDERFCHTFSIDEKLGEKEIKLTFKTIVDSVEYPKTETPEQLQLAEVMTRINELQVQAQKLQGLISK